MYFGWKVLLPLSLVNLVTTAVILILVPPETTQGLLGPMTHLSLLSPFVGVMVLVQIVVGLGALAIGAAHMPRGSRRIHLVDPSRIDPLRTEASRETILSTGSGS
jgi:multisubunit Na+/H+ antiporter MnhC subunit